MDQKNRLLKEAFEMLSQIEEGNIRPLASSKEWAMVVKLRDRIGKNLKINHSSLLK